MSDPQDPYAPQDPAPSTPAAQPPPYGYQSGYAYPPGYGAPAHPPGYGPPANPYAHWGLRLAGYLLDSVIVLPGVVLAEIGFSIAASSAEGGAGVAVGVVVAAVSYASIIGFSIWNQIIRQGRTGSSLGKQWVGIKVIGERTGQPLGGWLTFGRSLLHLLDALACYVGYLWPLWDAKRQTFADKIVGSVVVPRAADAPWQPPAATWPPVAG